MKRPGEQGTHFTARGEAATKPAAHGVHDAAFTEAENVPGEQSMQTSLTESRYVP